MIELLQVDHHKEVGVAGHQTDCLHGSRMCRRCSQVLRAALCAVGNIACFGAAAQVQSYVDGGGLPVVVRHVAHLDSQVRGAR